MWNEKGWNFGANAAGSFITAYHENALAHTSLKISVCVTNNMVIILILPTHRT
jgi:hypothetical protein